MALASLLIIGVFAVANDFPVLVEYGLWHGFDRSAVIAVVSSALGGLIVSAVLKYADSVLKGYATSASVILTGLLSAIAAGALRAQQRWGWHPVAAYGAFATLTPFTMIVCTPFFAMVIPYSIEVGNTNWTLPDDGLDPDYDRRLLKMQIVTTALAAIAIVVQTWWK